MLRFPKPETKRERQAMPFDKFVCAPWHVIQIQATNPGRGVGG